MTMTTLYRIRFKFKIHIALLLARYRLVFACSIMIAFFPFFLYGMGWRLLEYQPRLISALNIAAARVRRFAGRI